MTNAVEVSNAVKIGKEIALEVQLGRDDLESAWDHFVRAGEKLNEVRDNFVRGEWESYLKEACGISNPREAWSYMYIAKHADLAISGITGDKRNLGWDSMQRVVAGLLAQPEVEEKAKEIEAAAEHGDITHEQAVELKGKVAEASERLSKGAPVGKTQRELEDEIDRARREHAAEMDRTRRGNREARKTAEQIRTQKAQQAMAEVSRAGNAFVDGLRHVLQEYPDCLGAQFGVRVANIITQAERLVRPVNAGQHSIEDMEVQDAVVVA